MIQLQALNNILDNNNIDKYIMEGITADYFNQYETEYKFILKHYERYNKVPDWETFLSRFPNFEVVTVAEPLKMIIYYLKEEYLYEQSLKVFKECASILETDSFAAVENGISKLTGLLEEHDVNYGVNIQDCKDSLVQEILKKRALNNQGIIGIASGFDDLDEVTHGWLPGEELVTIVGRINQGKSWVLQKFLAEASRQGKGVLMYSGEMGRNQVINRHITLKHNISNRKLTTGDMTDEEIENYAQLLSTENQFQVITPMDLGGKQLTVSRLRVLIKKYKPDIVGIDQLSLMADERRQRGDNTKEQYAHISQDLFNLSTEFEIPILLAVQANRGRASEDKVENPELTNIAGSDDVGANSSRVISLATKDENMTLKLIKNRYGKVGWEKEFSTNFDKGEFKSIRFEYKNNKIKHDEDIF